MRWFGFGIVLSLWVSVGLQAEDKKITQADLFPQRVLRGCIGGDEVIAVLAELSSTHPVITELAARIDELLDIALGEKYIDIEQRRGAGAAQVCVLILMEKGISKICDVVERKMRLALFIPKHERRADFWLWVRVVCQKLFMLNKENKSFEDSLFYMYLQDCLGIASASPSAKLRAAGAREACILYNQNNAVTAVVEHAFKRYKGVDVAGLIHFALSAEYKKDQKAMAKIMGSLLCEDNQVAIAQLRLFLKDVSLKEPVYNFSRLTASTEARPFLLFEYVLIAGGAGLLELFLRRGFFEYKNDYFSPLAATLCAIKELSLISTWWKIRGWRAESGEYNWGAIKEDAQALMYSDGMTGPCEMIKELKNQLAREKDETRGHTRRLEVGGRNACFILSVLLDMHVLWWLAEKAPEGFGVTSDCAMAQELGRRIDAFRSAVLAKSGEDAKHAYTRVRQLIWSDECSIDEIVLVFKWGE